MPIFKGCSSKAKPTKLLDYITKGEKAIYVSSQNLDDSKNYAEQFSQTAKYWGKAQKTDSRKSYSFKLSFDPKDNIRHKECHTIALKIAERCFKGYECVIATHKDTEHVHSHIVMNSVNYADGKMLHINITIK